MKRKADPDDERGPSARELHTPDEKTVAPQPRACWWPGCKDGNVLRADGTWTVCKCCGGTGIIGRKRAEGLAYGQSGPTRPPAW